MSNNPLSSKIAAPYARALFDFSIEKNIMHQITADFQNLDIFLKENTLFTQYLNSPVVTDQVKQVILEKTLKSQLNKETFKFLMILAKRNRLNILLLIILNYMELVYETASVKKIQIITACNFTEIQEKSLIQKLKELTNAREIRLITTVDPSLIGGFLIKTDSKILDFTIKNQLQQLAKHLDTVLEI